MTPPLHITSTLDQMYNTEELKPELLVYLIQLSRSKKFDIVQEYNRSLEKWHKITSPSASELSSMVAFLGDVMLWYNKNISSLSQCTAPFMRTRLSLAQLDKLGLEWVMEMYSTAKKKSADPETDYYLHARWLWIQCAWFALKSTSKAINITDQESDALEDSSSDPIPSEITKNESPVNQRSQSRIKAITNAGPSKARSKINKIQGTPNPDNLEESYAKLNEAREAYDDIVVEVSERSRLLERLESLVSEKSRGKEKQHRQIATGTALLEQLHIRLNRVKEMTDTVIRIESIHEGILVTLESCRPSTLHLELEQQIALSKQQLLDLRRKEAIVDDQISKDSLEAKAIAAEAQIAMDERRVLQPQLQELEQLKVKKDLELKKERSFDPNALNSFNRRIKLEGILAKRRQRGGNVNGSKFSLGGEKETALHPMQKIANAAGSFDPLTIADKLQGSVSLCRELSLRQERSDILAKKRHAMLDDLHQMIKDHHLSRGKNPNPSLSMESNDDEDPQDARIALITRQSNLASLNSLVNNVRVAIRRLEDLADSIEQEDNEASLLPSFLFATDDSSCSDAKQMVARIRALRGSSPFTEKHVVIGDTPVSPESKEICNTRVKAKAERESR